MKRPVTGPGSRNHQNIAWHHDIRVMQLLDGKPEFMARYPKLFEKRVAEIKQFRKLARIQITSKKRRQINKKIKEVRRLTTSAK